MRSMEKFNLLGAIVTCIFFITAIGVFISRLANAPTIGFAMGIIPFFLLVPVLYLLFKAPEHHRPALYYVQLILFIIWLVVEFLLDYAYRLDFRNTKWIVIPYVTLFFAAAGGMLGVGSLAGRKWLRALVILFFTMGILAFVQRAVTGM